MKNLLKFLPIVFGMVNVESCQNAMQMHNNNWNMMQGKGLMNGMNMIPNNNINNNVWNNNQNFNNNKPVMNSNNMVFNNNLMNNNNCNNMNNNNNKCINQNMMMNGMNCVPVNQNMNNNFNNMNNINNNMNNQFMMNGNNLMMQQGQNWVDVNQIQNSIWHTIGLINNSKTMSNNQSYNVTNNKMINDNLNWIQSCLGTKQNGNINVNNQPLSNATMQYMQGFLTPKLEQKLVSLYQQANNSQKDSVDVSVDINNRDLFKASLSRAYQIIAQNGHLGLSHAGLNNIGATCYMNGTIQSLANDIEFLKSFFKSVVKHYDKLRNMNNNAAILTLEFANMIAELWNRAFPDNIYEHKQHGIKDLAPRKFKNILSASNPLFAGVAANDSKDLLLFLFETMHNALNQPNPQAVNAFNTNDPDFNFFANNYYPNNSSPILNNFYYVQQSKMVCCNCGYTTNNYNIMNIFISPLEKIRQRKAMVNNNSPLTTYDCITEAPDLLTGQNQIYCNNCRQNSNAMSCTAFHSLPNTLPIILNRGKGLQFTVPLQLQDVVDFGEYVNTGKDDAKYFLSSIVVHHGESGMAGHFVNISRTSPTSPWIMYNDAMVSVVSHDTLNSILNNNNNLGNVPYILFYKKRSDADLSSDLDNLCNEMKNKQNMSQNEIIYKQKMINEIQGAMLLQLGRDSAKMPAMPVGMNMVMNGKNMTPVNNQNFNNNVNNINNKPVMVNQMMPNNNVQINLNNINNINIDMNANQLLWYIFSNKNKSNGVICEQQASQKFPNAFNTLNFQNLNYIQALNYVNSLLRETVTFICSYKTRNNRSVCDQFAKAWNNVLSGLKVKHMQGKDWLNLYLLVEKLTQENNTINGNMPVNILELFHIYVPKDYSKVNIQMDINTLYKYMIYNQVSNQKEVQITTNEFNTQFNIASSILSGKLVLDNYTFAQYTTKLLQEMIRFINGYSQKDNHAGCQKFARAWAIVLGDAPRVISLAKKQEYKDALTYLYNKYQYLTIASNFISSNRRVNLLKLFNIDVAHMMSRKQN